MLTLRLLSGADSLRPLLDAARSGHEAPVMPYASHPGAPCACWHAGSPQACSGANAGWDAVSRPAAKVLANECARECTEAGHLAEKGGEDRRGPGSSAVQQRRADASRFLGHAEALERHTAGECLRGREEAGHGAEEDGSRQGGSVCGAAPLQNSVTDPLGPAEALDRRMAGAAGPAWAPEPELVLVWSTTCLDDWYHSVRSALCALMPFKLSLAALILQQRKHALVHESLAFCSRSGVWFYAGSKAGEPTEPRGPYCWSCSIAGKCSCWQCVPAGAPVVSVSDDVKAPGFACASLAGSVAAGVWTGVHAGVLSSLAAAFGGGVPPGRAAAADACALCGGAAAVSPHASALWRMKQT